MTHNIPQSHELASLKTVIESLPGNKVLRSFDSRVFRGLSIESTTENLDSLTSVGSVVNAWASKPVELSPVLHGRHFASDAEASNYSIHYMTGVDRLHREGILGQGVNVAVIDTGIDYNHSAVRWPSSKLMLVCVSNSSVAWRRIWPGIQSCWRL